MALVRDPSFWRRFSLAVHLAEDEEAARQTNPPTHAAWYGRRVQRSDSNSTNASGNSGSSGSRTVLKHQDTWLAREQRKRTHRTLICYGFWLGMVAFVTGIVALVMWLKRSGIWK